MNASRFAPKTILGKLLARRRRTPVRSILNRALMHGALMETMESRQMLSATIDVRLAGGGKTADITQVGQVVDMEVWAIIDGEDVLTSNDGFQSTIGSFLSTDIQGGAARGQLAAQPEAPFNTSGSAAGLSVDLDLDGDLDVGSNSNNSAVGFFVARSGGIQKTGGTVVDGNKEFKIATLTFTVTELVSNSQTQINFRKRAAQSAGLWLEDNATKDNNSGTLQSGTPVVLTYTTGPAPDATAPTAQLNAANLTTPGSSNYLFSVTYSDNIAVNASTIDSSDIRVTGPNGYSQVATKSTIDNTFNGTPRTATYRITAPGSWDISDNGTYTVSIIADQVADTSSNFIPAGDLGQFVVNVPDVSAPTASLIATPVNTEGSTDYQFNVTYSDDVAVNAALIDGSDVSVSGPNGFVQAAALVGVNSPGNGLARTATYSITAPGGTFDLADNGLYTVSLASGQIADTSNNFTAGSALGQFNVSIADQVAPTALATFADVTSAGGIVYEFSVTYFDNVAVNVATLGSTDIQVTGPGGFNQLVTFAGADENVNGTPRTAGYRLSAPGGAFDFADNGIYTVILRSNEVFDTGTNPVANGTLGTFNVNIPDTSPPSASLSASDLTSPGAGVYTFAVTYTDDTQIVVTTLDSQDVEVTGPGGFAQLATFVGVDEDSDGSPRIATYRIDAPGGVFDARDNGTYTVSLKADQVKDQADQSVSAGALGEFSVNIPDTTSPTASLSASTITTTNVGQPFTVIYSDDIAIDQQTLGSGDVLVTGPGDFSQAASLVNIEQDDGGVRRAIYNFPAPGGSFGAEDNGTYAVQMVASEVKDSSGNSVIAGVLGNIQINIAVNGAPSASLSPISITSPTNEDQILTVTYHDDVAVKLSSLGGNDLQITGPNGFSAAAQLVNANPAADAATIVATYSFTPPGGGFDLGDNGSYTVALLPDSVRDSADTSVPAGTLGTFSVSIPDVAPPSAALTAESITSAGVTSHTFTITFSDNVAIDVSTLSSASVRVSGPNGFSQLAALLNVDSESDGSPRTGTFSISAPGGEFDETDNGAYAVLIESNQVNDTSGNSLPGGSIGQFTVDVPPPGDSTPPSAILTEPIPGLTAINANIFFKVTYNDDTGIAATSIGTDDLIVTGPAGFSQTLHLASIEDGTGNAKIVTYAVGPSNGTFSSALNGTYTISTVAGAVTDIAGNPIPQTVISTFQVNINGERPKAKVIAPRVTRSSRTYIFKVIYTGKTSEVFTDSIVTGSIRVTGPNGFKQIARLIAATPEGSSKRVVATYRIKAPGGAWDPSDNGTYNIIVRAGQVFNKLDNAAAAGKVGTFTVKIA